MKGGNTSETVTQALKDIVSSSIGLKLSSIVKKPNWIFLNDIGLEGDQTSGMGTFPWIVHGNWGHLYYTLSAQNKSCFSLKNWGQSWFSCICPGPRKLRSYGHPIVLMLPIRETCEIICLMYFAVCLEETKCSAVQEVSCCDVLLKLIIR